MKKLIAVILLGVFAANAGDITLTFTDSQANALTRIVSRMNAEKLATAQAAGEDTNAVQLVTVNAYMQLLFESKLASLEKAEQKLIIAEVAAKYEQAPEPTKQQVDSTLGVQQ